MSDGEIVIVKSTQLSIKEIDVELVQMAADGYSRVDMAAKINKSLKTVDWRFEQLRDLLDAKNRGHLIAIFFRKGFIK